MNQLKAAVVSALEVMPENYIIWLEAPEIAVGARPGQFLMVGCGEDTVLPRPFSVHRADNNRIAILFNIVGKGTRWLSLRKKGDTLNIFGPLGNGFTIDPDARNLLIVAGGIGIAPLCFLAERAAAAGKKVTLLIGARSAGCLFPVSSPQSLYDGGMLPSNICVITATDDGSEGCRGPVTGLVPAYAEGIDQIFACGPLAMYRTMAQMPELKGKFVQISLEITMGCGTGVCYGCTIRTKNGLKQVCTDGPVFDIGEVEWGELKGTPTPRRNFFSPDSRT